uniref:Putative secreted protein n=1 Tax=Anopheles triannulatus TaxID=58253 RepID=A0A2M4B6C3_9DIPT
MMTDGAVVSASVIVASTTCCQSATSSGTSVSVSVPETLGDSFITSMMSCSMSTDALAMTVSLLHPAVGSSVTSVVVEVQNDDGDGILGFRRFVATPEVDGCCSCGATGTSAGCGCDVTGACCGVWLWW